MKAVAGKRLSVRDIGLLAEAYFRGPLRGSDRGGQGGMVVFIN